MKTAKQAQQPSKADGRTLNAIMKAAKQIHEEFDCLSDHVQTKGEIHQQIASIIWRQLERVR